MSKWRNILMLIAVAGMMTVFCGCEEPSTSEKIGQKVEKAGKDIEKAPIKLKKVWLMLLTKVQMRWIIWQTA